RIGDGVSHRRGHSLSALGSGEVAVDALLDERVESGAVHTEPARDDRLLRATRERLAVLGLRERAAVLGEQLLVDGEEDRLVVRERPVEVEGNGSDRAHLAGERTVS